MRQCALAVLVILLGTGCSTPTQVGHDARSHTEIARAALAQRNFQDALDEARQAIQADTGSAPARYIAAVAERELGTGLLRRNTRWHSSRRNFEWVVRRDSSFDDVLFQYALLERYENHQDHALELAQAQVWRKPDLVVPQLGLYKMFKYWMAEQDSAEFLGWLRSRKGDLPEFFAAETYRRNGDCAAAETLLTQLLNRESAVSPQALRLALSSVRFSRGDRDGAEAEYWRAIRELHTDLGAAILFENLKTIVADAELDTYHGLTSIAAKQEFFRNFWNFRNPSLALKSNLRLQEHIRRSIVCEDLHEFYGFRTRFNNPDRLHELNFPRAFALNDELNDKGLIYLRYGEPDDVLRAAASPFENEEELTGGLGIGLTDKFARWFRPPANSVHERDAIGKERESRLAEGMRPTSGQQDPAESWLYNATAESPRLIFYFQKHNAGGNNWRLSPSPESDAMMEELLLWDVHYARLFTERDLTRSAVGERIKAIEKADVGFALSTERQTWEKTRETFRFAHAIDVFRAPDGRALLDISYAIPLAPLARHLADTVRSIPVELGVSMVDAHAQRTYAVLDTMQIGLSRTRTGVVIDLARYTVPPDSYAVSMHIRPLQGNALGTWRQPLRVQDFSRPGLMASSLQLLRPSPEQSSMIIDGVKVTQSPFRTHVRTDSLYLYFQIYHLVPDAFGTTAYKTECILLAEDESDLADGKLIYQAERMGKEEMAAEFYAIDVRSADPGKYTLVVKITDRKRVQTILAAREVQIVTP